VRGLQGFESNHCADPVWWRRDYSIINNFLWKLLDDLISLKSDLSIISPLEKLENVIFLTMLLVRSIRGRLMTNFGRELDGFPLPTIFFPSTWLRNGAYLNVIYFWFILRENRLHSDGVK